jgi:carbon storage regulator
MLVLGRNLGDTIIINDNITIKFFKGKGADFKVAIDAPKDVKIVRGEVDERRKEREARFAYLGEH